MNPFTKWSVWPRIVALLLACLSASCGSFQGDRQAKGLAGDQALGRFEMLKWTVNRGAYDAMASGAGRIEVALTEQRLRLLDENGRTVIKPDCSTGMAEKETPKGEFEILEKIQDKRSDLYGSYVSESTGEVLEPRSWLVPRPPGSRFVGTEMPYWMRITWTGVGIHVGRFHRGRRTSMGCIRMPSEVQPLIFAKSKVGMRVVVK